MASYFVTNTVRFSGYVEADSEAEAEEIGYYYDNLEYDCVEDVVVELEEEEDEDEDWALRTQRRQPLYVLWGWYEWLRLPNTKLTNAR